MTTIVIVLALVAAAAAAAGAVLVLLPARRRARLRERFGPEYDIAVARHGDRREAERRLADREKRVAELAPRPLDEASRAACAARWTAAQERFVDEPAAAVAEAEELIGAVMRERGYPDGTGEERLELLSVEHARTLAHYRAALVLLRGPDPGTEDLRRAMLHLRTLFTELAGAPAPSPGAAPARPGG